MMSSTDEKESTIQPELAPDAIVEDVQAPDSKPPDGGYGWVCVLASFLINGFTWGICACYGVYLNYYLTHQIFPGATSIDYAFVGGSNFGAALVTGPLVNAALRKVGTHPVMYFGCCMWLLGWVTASFSKTLWQLVLSQGICTGVGLGAIWQPSTGIISQWFIKRRSMAQGFTSAGSGVIGIIYSVSTTPMIENLSLAWAQRITGITSFTILVVATTLIRDRNKVVRPTIHPFDFKLLRNYHVCLVLGWSVFNLLGYIVALYSFANYGRTLGLDTHQTSTVITMLNLGTALGRMFMGPVSDRVGRVTVAATMTGTSSILCFAWWINARNYSSLLAFAVVCGMIFGCYWGTIAPISAEVVDLRDLPSMLSMVWLTDVAPTLCSEAIALKLLRKDSGRPYLYVQIYTGLCYLVGAAALFELKRSRWGLFKKEVNR